MNIALRKGDADVVFAQYPLNREIEIAAYIVLLDRVANPCEQIEIKGRITEIQETYSWRRIIKNIGILRSGLQKTRFDQLYI